MGTPECKSFWCQTKSLLNQAEPAARSRCQCFLFSIPSLPPLPGSTQGPLISQPYLGYALKEVLWVGLSMCGESLSTRDVRLVKSAPQVTWSQPHLRLADSSLLLQMLTALLSSGLALFGALICFITSGVALKDGPFCMFHVSSFNQTQTWKYGYPFKDLHNR